MKIKVRKFKRQDAEAVRKMNDRLSVYHDSKTTITAKKLADICLRQKMMSCFVAEMGGKLAGYAMSYDWINMEHGTRVCVVSQLYTEEKFRRHGVGLALMRYAAKEALQRGCFRLTVNAEKSNRVSNAFYKRSGFYLRNPQSNRYVIQAETLKKFASIKG